MGKRQKAQMGRIVASVPIDIMFAILAQMPKEDNPIEFRRMQDDLAAQGYDKMPIPRGPYFTSDKN